MPSGFHGKYLQVDLTEKKLTEQKIPERLFAKYLGGSGLAARLLFDELISIDNPFAPESPLFFMTGLLTGNKIPTACKVSVCGRSPLTGIWNEATGGGHWAAKFRGTGYDGIKISGAASKPVYLLIDGDQTALCDADNLWGKDTFEVHQELTQRHGKQAGVASIGQAGENKVLFAGIMFDGIHARSAARGGMGALLGSKNLKAIVVISNRNKKPKIADPKGLQEAVRTDTGPIRKFAAGLTNFGTGGGVEAVEFWGDLPIKNWQLGSWQEGATKICAQTYLPKTLDKHHACFACPIRCSKIVKLKEGKYAGVHSHGPEYETLAGFGSNCLNDDYEVIMAANEYCNRTGMDTISASSMVAFAMEAHEKGVLSPDDAEGLSLKWGDKDTIMGLLDQMAHRRAIGEILAQGSRIAAIKIGKNTEEYAIHTKGMEYPFHDPRAFTSMAVHYATANRGACHLDGLTYFIARGIPAADLGYTEPQDPHSNENKAEITVDLQNYLELFNSLGLCKFLFLARCGTKILSNWINLATGWELTPEELLLIGERINNLKRYLNTEIGISRKDDKLPHRLFAHARPDGKSAGVLPHLGLMLYEYYKIRGWSPEGIPTEETLIRLGIKNRQMD